MFLGTHFLTCAHLSLVLPSSSCSLSTTTADPASSNEVKWLLEGVWSPSPAPPATGLLLLLVTSDTPESPYMESWRLVGVSSHMGAGERSNLGLWRQKRVG